MGGIFMDWFYIACAVVLTVLFFLNIRSASDILCRIAGGFAVLMLYNTLSAVLPVSPVGINLISSAVSGIMGLPGAILLILCGKLF